MQTCGSLAHCLRRQIVSLVQAEFPLYGGGFDVVTLESTIAELLKSKRAANKREEYVKSLKYYLETFAAGYEKSDIREFDFLKIEKRLGEICGGQSDNSRQTWFNRVNTLFSFAAKRGIIAANPMDRLERVSVDRKDPFVLTVEQCDKLFKTVPEVMRAYLVLSLYAGVRPCGELNRLKWDCINLDAGTVAINFPKVRKQRRIVKLEPLAIAKLRECLVKSGDVAPSASTVRRWKRKARAVLGLQQWPQDCLRHTAASYLLALRKDAAMVALELGNSPHILMTHYVVPVSDECCKKFWNL